VIKWTASLKVYEERSEDKNSLRESHMRRGKEMLPILGIEALLSCTLSAVLPTLLAPMQEVWICYLVFLLAIVIVCFGEVDIFFSPHCIDL